MSDRTSRSVDTVILAKACAMVLMVANHSRLSQALFDVPALYGGLNAMLVISGLTMATHAFQHDTRRTLRAFARFGLRLAVPCLAVAAVWDTLMLALGARDITLFKYFAELALFSNWLSTHKLALFPIWYVQAVVQMLAGLGLLFLLCDLTPRIRKAPVAVTGALLALALAGALASYASWDTSALEDRLPHLLVWNFVLGWLIWAVQRGGRTSRGGKLAITAVLLAAVAMVYLASPANNGVSRAFWMTAIVLPVIWRHRVSLPGPLVHLVHLIAQSVFAIFLLHFYVFGLIEEPLKHFGLDQPVVLALLKLAAGLAVPVLCWAWFTAFMRVRRKRTVQRRMEAAPPAP